MQKVKTTYLTTSITSEGVGAALSALNGISFSSNEDSEWTELKNNWHAICFKRV